MKKYQENIVIKQILKQSVGKFYNPAYWQIFIIVFLLGLQVGAQTLTVQGTVKTATVPVQNALITFTDHLDTNTFYSALTDSLGNYQLTVPTVAIKSQNNVPTEFDLEQNYPNPFSASTTIPYALKKHSKVFITIYDLLGREVRKIEVGLKPVGTYQILWDGCNNYGHKVATGLYFYRFQVGNESKVRKMIYGADGNGMIALPQANYQPISKPNLELSSNVQESVFDVLIENRFDTKPAIISKRIDEVVIQGDTTIDFSVLAIPDATIYSDSLHQFIRGFGAANIMPWRGDMADSEIQTAFGTGDGQLGFSMLRLRLPSGTGWDFSIQVATAKKASDMGVLVFASPWSPPAALKSNNNTTGGYLLENHYQDFVDHLNSFIDFMADSGVSLYAVSVQNEPDIEVTYESCDYTPDQMKNFMADYADGIKTKVIAPESFQFRKNMSDPILNDSAACANLDIIGGHIYGGGLESYPLAEEKGKEIWMTEYLDLDTDWSAALGTGKQIHDCMHYGMSAYVWWYIVRFYGPIDDGEEGGVKGRVTKRGYVMSQFSRFIRPGYQRIECPATPQKFVYMTAYKDDASSKIVLVVLNTSSFSEVQQIFTLPDGTMTACTPYTTTATKNCQKADDIPVIDGKIAVTLEPSSITTFVSKY